MQHTYPSPHPWRFGIAACVGLLTTLTSFAQSSITVVGPTFCDGGSVGQVAEYAISVFMSDYDIDKHEISVKGGKITAIRTSNVGAWNEFPSPASSYTFLYEIDGAVPYVNVRVAWDESEPKLSVKSKVTTKTWIGVGGSSDNGKFKIGWYAQENEERTLYVRNIPQMGNITYSNPVCQASSTTLTSSHGTSCPEPVGFEWFRDGRLISTTSGPSLSVNLDRYKSNGISVRPKFGSNAYFRSNIYSNSRVDIEDISRAATVPPVRRYTQISGFSQAIHGEWANYSVSSNEQPSAYEWRFSDNRIAIAQGSRTSSNVRLVSMGDWPASFEVSCRVTTCNGTFWVRKRVTGAPGSGPGSPQGPGAPPIPLTISPEVDVYPNPVSEGGILNLPRDVVWTSNSFVLDATGRTVGVVSVADSRWIELPDVTPGVYMLHIPESEFNSTFIVE